MAVPEDADVPPSWPAERKQNMNRNLHRTLAAIALGGVALSAQAVPVKWLGFAAGSQNVTVGETNNPDQYVSAAAGAFRVAVDGQTVVTYCVELTQGATSTLLDYALLDGETYFNINYSPGLLATGATIVDRLGRLFTSLGGMNTPVAQGAYSAAMVSAATQLAVWESVYEGDNPLTLSGPQNDLTNKFWARTAPADAVTLANAMLASAAQVTSVYGVSVVRYGVQPGDMQAQDYLLLQRLQGNDAPPAVPEPGTLALAGLALGAAGWLRRRRA